VRAAQLREDLYYRLNVFTINLPPLRERGEDIQLLAQHFLDDLNAEEGRRSAGRRRAGALAERPWRGNVRELRNAVTRRTSSRIARSARTCSRRTSRSATARRRAVRDDGTLEVSVGSEIAAVEKRLILATLDHFEGDKKHAALALGISLKTLYNRLAVYRAERARERGVSDARTRIRSDCRVGRLVELDPVADASAK
jgi:DNA-binding NtrC family response regulator